MDSIIGAHRNGDWHPRAGLENGIGVRKLGDSQKVHLRLVPTKDCVTKL